MKKEFCIRAADMQDGDIFVRWDERSVNHSRLVYVLRETPALPTKVGSRVIDTHGTIFALSAPGLWISLRTGQGHEAYMFNEIFWRVYGQDEITVEQVQESISRYADSVQRHNGMQWITEAGRRRIAEEVVKDLNNECE